MFTPPDPREYVRFRCTTPGCTFYLLAHPDVIKPICMFCQDRVDASFRRPDRWLPHLWHLLARHMGKLKVYNRYDRSITDARSSLTY